MSTKILFITTGLESGGAEMSLFKTAALLQQDGFECAVVSLTGEGPILGRKIREQGIPLWVAGGRRGVPNPLMLGKIAQYIRAFKPDVVQTWLYHADLLGGLAARLTGKVPIVWSVHNTVLDPAFTKRLTLWVVRANRVLSGWLPTKIACCSEAALAVHAELGYDERKMMVIHSGVDARQFVPDADAYTSVREELGLAADTPLVGLMARFDPQKDHELFFRAAGHLNRARPDVHFLLCGTGVTPENEHLARWAEENGVADVVHLLGLRTDTPRLTAALNAASSCSRYGESFCLALVEAMSCGVPVVTTDMAGPVSVVGDCGRVVPVGDDRALADAWQEMVQSMPNGREEYGIKARQRVTDHFSIERSAQGYARLYRSLVPAHVSPSATPQKGHA